MGLVFGKTRHKYDVRRWKDLTKGEQDRLHHPRMKKTPIKRRPNCKLPTSVDLSGKDPFPIEDQGQVGSCTANSTAAAYHYCVKSESIADIVPSRMFLYYNARYLYGDLNEDGGSTNADAVKGVLEWGVCSEDSWPYDTSIEFTEPTQRCYDEAANNIATSARQVGTGVDDMKQCLADGYPFILAFIVYSSFLNIGSDGMMPMPRDGEEQLGGHSVCVVGYDDSKQVLILRNSWGTSWGHNGFFYMPYEFVTDDGIFDPWCITWVDGGESGARKKHHISHAEKRPLHAHHHHPHKRHKS